MELRATVLLAIVALTACTRAEVPLVERAVAVPPPVFVAARPAPAMDTRDVPSGLPLPADAGAFRKCAACHSLSPGRNGLGPSLAGVFGRSAASEPSYRYSDALRSSGLIWDVATLDRFLANPRDAMPGTKMIFRGLSDPAERAQVIAFIQRH